MIVHPARILGFLLVVAAAACGGSSPGGGGGGGGGGGADAPRPIDAAPDAAPYDFGCGGNTACLMTDVCCAMPSSSSTTFSCVTPGSCPTGDKITCDGPDECGGTTPVCCGVDVGDGTGSYPQCGVSKLGTSCTTAAACPTHLAQSCSDTTKVQICHVSSECMDPQNPLCCTFSSGGAMLTFCTDSTTAQFAGATCH